MYQEKFHYDVFYKEDDFEYVVFPKHESIHFGVFHHGILAASAAIDRDFQDSKDHIYLRISFLFVDESYSKNQLDEKMVTACLAVMSLVNRPCTWISSIDGESNQMRELLKKFGLIEMRVLDLTDKPVLAQEISETKENMKKMNLNLIQSLKGYLESGEKGGAKQ